MTKSRSTKAIVLASGEGLTALVALIAAAILSRLFAENDYGTYRQTLLAFAFATPFVALGFQQALVYFLPNETQRPRGVVLENLLLLAFGGALLGVFLLAGGSHLLAKKNPDLAWTLKIMAPYPLLILPAGSLSACLLARERVGQAAAFTVASRLLLLVMVVVPCFFWTQPKTAIIGVVASACITAPAAWWLMFRSCPPGSWRPTAAGFRRQIGFGVPLGLSTLADRVRSDLDKVMVAALCVPEKFAIYVNGAIQLPLISIVTRSVAPVLIVDYAQLYREQRYGEIVGLIHRATAKCAMVLIAAMGFLLCVAPEFMRLLYGAKYVESAEPFRIYLLILPLRSFNFASVIVGTGHNHHVMIRAVITVLPNIALAWWAIGAFGPIGAAAATVAVSYCIGMPYYLAVLQRILHCPFYRLFPWVSLLKTGAGCAAAAAVVMGARHLLADWPDLPLLAVSGTAYTVTVLALFSAFGLVDLAAMLSRLRQLIGGKP